MDIELIPLLKDNYGYLLRDGDFTAVVDPADAVAVGDFLTERNLGLDLIINTHHHWDHTGGNLALKERYRCPIAGPAADAHRIDGMGTELREGDTLRVGSAEGKVLETPGHTSGHISIYFAKDKAVFCGDTMFAMGCGRLFEGTPEQMWNSLGKLAALPDDTRVYCGHEYTLANGEFCVSVEPENADIRARLEDVRAARADNLPTIPSTIGLERRTNAFLRAGTAERFATLRRLKDHS